MKKISFMLILILALMAIFTGSSSYPVRSAGEQDSLNLALIWHQHQPLYKDVRSQEYVLPWARVHAVQEYLDSPSILTESDGIVVTYNLVPSLIDQIEDYAEITKEEKDQSGVFKYIGASDPHLELALKDPKELSRDEREKIESEFFSLNPYMFDDDGDDPYYSARFAELREISRERNLTTQEITDLTALFFLWQISPRYHEEYGLSDLRGKENYERSDIVRIIEAQKSICSDLLEAYRLVEKEGSEIITSPYYHPILPLLMSDGWEGVSKDPWPSDTQDQLRQGINRYKEIFGYEPSGLWPPEQAVSQSIVNPVVESGFDWFVSDRGVLADSLGRTPDISRLTKPYRVSSQQGDAYVIFRHSELSDNISFSYGNKSTDYAVEDFMKTLRGIREKLDNPGESLLTVAVDGENWMFMAGYPNNGRSFLKQLYKRLARAEWVETTTPGKFLENYEGEAAKIDELATGSWAGDLSTWRGEPEEDQAWRRLIEARKATQEESPRSSARSAILAAEGSDWFWWYGTDKDSGDDETFDHLFKTHLINAYRKSGYSREDMPAELFVEKIPPTNENLGEVKVTLDGKITSEEEWKNAVHFQPDDSEVFSDFYLGYGPNNFYVRIDTREEARNLIGDDLNFSLYMSGSGKGNAETRFGEEKMGFSLAQMISLNMEDVEEDGDWNVFRYKANGSGNWDFASNISNLPRRKAKVGEIIEFKFPYETVNIEPEENFLLRLAAERRNPGTQLSVAPGRPVRTRIPKPIGGTRVFSASDPKGDDYGPGDYTYPKDTVFDHEGLFDLQEYEIYDAGDKWLLIFEFGAMTNPWDAPLGFSHQLINLYMDTEEGGEVEPHKKGAGVRFSPEAPWNYFIKIAGWPGYGRELVTADGEKYKIDVSSDVKHKRVIAGISKELLPKINGNHYLMVFSQDGYGQDHIRTVQEEASTWQGGGAESPVAPNVYDYLAPSGEQEETLSSYDQDEGEFVTLRPFKVSLSSSTGGDDRE